MTVTNQEYKALYATDGATTDFPFNFKATDASWIKCYLAEDPAAPPVEVFNFTVVLNSDQEVTPGGVVTFDTSVPTGTLAIARITPVTQALDYTAYDAFPAESHEKGLDKITYAQQWTLGEAARGVRYGFITDTVADGSATLMPFTNVGFYLRWREDGLIESVNLEAEGIAVKGYVDAQDAILQGQITTNANAINTKAATTYVDAQDATLQGQITANAGDISTKADKTYVDAQDSGLQSQITTNAGDISTKADKTYVDAQDVGLQSQITTNAGDITSNTNSINGLTTDKADKSIQMVSSSLDMLTITNPTIDSNVNFSLITNVALGTVQLDGFGFVPESHLPPNGGLRIFGLWDASTGDNPTDTRPDLVPYKSGDTYITAEGGGNIPLLDPVTGLYVPTAVLEGDLLIYVVNFDNTVIGWAKGSNVDTGSVSAALVSFVPAGDITSVEVQSGMEELDTKKLAKTGGDMSGSIIFNNAVGVRGRKLDTTEVALAQVGLDDGVELGAVVASEVRTYSGGAFVSMDASYLPIMTLAQDGVLDLTNKLRLPNNVALQASNAATTLNHDIAHIDSSDRLMLGQSDINQTYVHGLNNVVITIGGLNSVVASTTGIDVTGSVVATGNFALANSISLVGRNVADTVNLSIGYISNLDEVILGDISSPMELKAAGSITLQAAGANSLVVTPTGIDVTGNASSTLAPTLPEHLTTKAYVDAMFPLGTVVLRGNDTDPNGSLPGTWVSKGTSHSLYAVPVAGGAGTVGGSNAVAVPLLEHGHTATFAGSAMAAHIHAFGTCNGGDDGTYGTLEYGNSTVQLPPNSNQVHAASAGTPAGTVSVTAAGTPAATMSVEGATYSVVAWERTA